MDFQPSQRAEAIRERMTAFFEAHVLPRHRDWVQCVMREGRVAPFVSELQDAARSEGLWNLALPLLEENEPGTRLSNLEFAPLAEIMGRLPWGSEVFNCQAPDVPNMAMLQALATPEQKARWLRPLLNAQTRSAFAMTEPNVASSDATNIATRLTFAGDRIRIDGHKWFSTGAAHPECSVLIVMGVSDPGAGRTAQHSMVLVPTDTPGVRIVRTQSYMGWHDHVAPIGEIVFEGAEVPASHLLGTRGAGFAGAQIRLSPARIHHCMRCIGLAEMLVQMMGARARERSAFGRPVIDYDTVQRWIAEARVAIEQARLLVQRAAWMVDRGEGRDTWRQVSLCKVAVPNMLQTVTDRAAQICGAMGGLEDMLVHHAFAYARWFRIGDGPDEVHLRQIYRSEPEPPWRLAESPYVATPPCSPGPKALETA